MRSQALVLCLFLSLPVHAQELRVDHAKLRTSFRVGDSVSEQPLPDVERIASSLKKADFTLGCENDNQIDPAGALALLRGDLAGSFLPLPEPGQRYEVNDVSIGLIDVGASYPTDVSIQLFVYDGAQYYNSIGAFVATLTEPLAAGGEILEFDLTPFALEADDRMLVLFGQHRDAGAPRLFPAVDASPRCNMGDSATLCSVILAENESQLFIYGYEDAELCTGRDPLLLADVVVELGISERTVARKASSLGAIKARF